VSLRTLLGFGKKLLSGKKESALPATGQQTKQITYTPKPSQASGQELAVREIKNPPVVLKQTKPLQMGDDIAPSFGSSTYDWAMRKGRGSYTADEWLDHLTSTRKVNFNIFGKPAQETVREFKKFKYDRGPFAGKEVNVSREELFDSNLAIFNDKNDLTGGLLYAAQKFGLKLTANDVGAMLKLNPINRLKTETFGIPQKAVEEITSKANKNLTIVEGLRKKYRNINEDISDELDDAIYYMKSLRDSSRSDFSQTGKETIEKLVRARDKLPIDDLNDRKLFNSIIGEISEGVKPFSSVNKPKYYNNDQTLMGGQNYRETVFYLDEPVKGNKFPLDTRPYGEGGPHFSGVGPIKNEIFHVRFDTRFTPEGKKVLTIHQIQADAGQKVAKSLSREKQLDGINRRNPFQKDIEESMFVKNQEKLQKELAASELTGDPAKIYRAADNLSRNTKKITEAAKAKYDYLPMPEASDYNDHALKYLMQLGAKEGADYVAVIPFNMLNYKASYDGFAGNERAYGYANGKGINKKGKALIPELMKKAARFYDSKAGQIKISRSDPKKPYKYITSENYTYRDGHSLKGQKFTRTAHDDASLKEKEGYKFMSADDPNLYFDAFAIKVNPLMRNTQKTYRSKGGLVVDMFKSMRYN
jgi:hypothetical protein